jgi:N-acetylmuramoyl-L-alanine amidase-like protein/putative peptidoglycan binding protein
MAFSLVWMPMVLRAAGLKVAVVDGWEERGLGDVGPTHGVLCHHTGGSKNGNMPSLQLLINGRPDLRGPLTQLGLGRDGTYYVVAAGRCNHAGQGIWNGIIDGNRHFIGIEAENTGRVDDPWPDVQVDAYRRGVAALLKHAGLDAGCCAGHREYALPQGRKPDPTLDMIAFRAAVARVLDGSAAPFVLIPSAEPDGPRPSRPTLRRGAQGEWVKQVQALLGLRVDGDFGGTMEACVRALQRTHRLVPDGIIGPKTWLILDAVSAGSRAPLDPYERAHARGARHLDAE